MAGITRFFSGKTALKKITAYPVPVDVNEAGRALPVRSLIVRDGSSQYHDRQARGSSAVYDKITQGRIYTIELETDLGYENMGELILAAGLGSINNAGVTVPSATATYEYAYHMNDNPNKFLNAAVDMQVTDSYNETGIYEYTGCIPTSFTVSGRAGAEPVRLRATLLAFDELFRISTTLASNIGAGDTEITASGKGSFFNDTGYIILDNGTSIEYVLYRGIDRVNNKFLNCLRGQLGSTASAFTTAPTTNIHSLSATTSLSSATVPQVPLVEWDDLSFRINPNSSGSLTGADVKSISGFSLTVNLNMSQRIGMTGFMEQPVKADFNEVTLSIDRHRIEENRPRFDLKNDVPYKAELIFTNPNIVDSSDGLPYRMRILLPNLKFTEAPRNIGSGRDVAPTDTYVALESNQPSGMSLLPDGSTTLNRELAIIFRNGRSSSLLT